MPHNLSLDECRALPAPAKGEQRTFLAWGVPGLAVAVTPQGRRSICYLYNLRVHGRRTSRRIVLAALDDTRPFVFERKAYSMTRKGLTGAAGVLRGVVLAGRDPWLEMRTARDAEHAAAREAVAQRKAHEKAAREAERTERRTLAEQRKADAEARRLARALAATERREAVTVAKVCAMYIAAREASARRGRRTLSPRTAAEYRRLATQLIAPVIGDVRIEDVCDEDAERLARRLRVRPVQMNRCRQLLHAVLRWAARPRVALRSAEKANPFARHDDDPWHDEEETREPMTGAETDRLLKALETMPGRDTGSAYDAIYLAVVTGWRRGEVLSLRWDALNLADKVAVLKDTKTGTSRRPLGDLALNLLRRLPRSSPYVFPSPNDRSLPVREIRRPWNALRREAGITKTFHSLRHGRATIALSAGVPLAVVGSLLGHRDPATTRRYAKVIDEAGRKAAQIADAALMQIDLPSHAIASREKGS